MNQSQILIYVSQHLPAELRLMQTGGYAAAYPELTPAEKAVIYHYTQVLFSAAWLPQPQWQQLLAATEGTALVDAAPLVWPAFLSASRTLHIAEQHLNYSPKSCLLSIRSKTGRLVEALSHYGPNGPDPAQNEREVLFLPNTQFRAVSVSLVTSWPEIGLVEL